MGNNASISRELKYTAIAAVVSVLILLPVLAHLMNSSSVSTTPSNHVIPITNQERNALSFIDDQSSVITQFQAGHDFMKMGPVGQQLDDAGDFVLGKQSVKLTTEGDGLPVFTRKIGISPALNMTDKSINIWLKVSDTSNIRELRVTATGDRFQTLRNYWLFTMDGVIRTELGDNEWAFVTINLENSRDLENPDLQAIDTIQLRVVDNGKGPVSVWFNGLSVTQNIKGES